VGKGGNGRKSRWYPNGKQKGQKKETGGKRRVAEKTGKTGNEGCRSGPIEKTGSGVDFVLHHGQGGTKQKMI